MSLRLKIPIWVAFAAVALAAVFLVLLAGGSTTPSAAKPDKPKPPVVGKVTKIGGTKKITVKQDGAKKARRLEAGDKLRLGDVIDPDQGVAAKFALKVPQGVSDDKELIYVAPGKGDKHTITLTKPDKKTTNVTIGN